MRPDDRDFDEEIRANLAINVRERIERGEDPVAARRAALDELGYVPAIRDSLHRVWYSRWFDAVTSLGREMRIGLRSLLRAKGLATTVGVTLALGIGANAAIFSVVRGVLLRPLVNRGEDRLVYIRQGAPGIGVENTTLSVPEIDDFKAKSKTISAFGDFSTTTFILLGMGEPQVLRAGVVGGSYFDVMGLRPAFGRLITRSDDGKTAAPVAVLTHRYWVKAFNSDPLVVGRQLQFRTGSATIVGVLEPCVPYPLETEIIANMVTSEHHLGATMNTDRTHRMTELFGRLTPGASVDQARAELVAAHAAMMSEHPESYLPNARVRISVTPLRDQITAPARTILLVLLSAAAIVFVIACSNVANLILARSVRRDGELAVRAALGASRGALRRTLLAESLVLCGIGAFFGILIARPLVAVVAEYAARFSVRATEVTVDNTVLWVGAGLAIAAAILLAYVPRLPTSTASAGLGLTSGSLRITPATNRRLRAFATTQIAFSFVLLAAAGMLVTTLIALQGDNSGYDTRHVLVLEAPGFTTQSGDRPDRFEEVRERIGLLPGVTGVSGGSFAPWRDAGSQATFQFTAEGYSPAPGEENPTGRPRFVGSGFFATLGIPMIAGRDFSTADLKGENGRVVIVSQSVAQRFFPNGDAVDRRLWATDIDWWRRALSLGRVDNPARIIGVVADVDDEHVQRGPAMTIYSPLFLGYFGDRLFVRSTDDPMALVPAITRILREVKPEQPIENPATLEDLRAKVMTPERLNTFVVAGFAGIALLIAVVGVSGVLAFSVSARMREFGIRLAVGSAPQHLLVRVLSEGIVIVTIGIVTGAAVVYLMAGLAATYFDRVRVPGVLAVMVAAAVLGCAAVTASFLPALRAARVDVLRALRAE